MKYGYTLPHSATATAITYDKPLGGLLQERRLELEWSLEHVAQILKIRKFFLEAIEAGNYNDLPGGVYTVGFVRSYAGLLGLDETQIVQQLQGQHREYVSWGDFGNNTVALDKAPRFTRRHLLMAVAVLAAALTFAYFKHMRSSPPAPPVPAANVIADTASAKIL